MTVNEDWRTAQFFDDTYIQDPYPLYDQLRDRGPVHQVDDSGFYVVCGWDAINEVIGRPDDFSANLTMTYSPTDGVAPFEMGELAGPTQVLATADDPSHAVHRKMLVPQLAAKRIRATEPIVSATAERLWNQGVHDGRIEWMGAMANRLPMLVVARLIGVPIEDVDMLIAKGFATTQLLDGLVDADQLAAAGIAAMELSVYITEHFEQAAADPQDNLLGDLATACATGELDETTGRVMMLTLFSAGGESTASLLGSAMWLLASRPPVQRQVRDDPELLPAFIEETLRFEPPFRGHYRHVVNDVVLGDVHVPAGSRLLLLWGAGTAIPCSSTARTSFASIGRRVRGTSRSARVPISALGRRWHA